MHSSANLFQLQAELIDGKVDMAVSKSIGPVLDKIESLRHEMHGMKHEMHNMKYEIHQEISGLRQEMGSRLSAVETALGMRTIVKAHFLDYSFKAGWLMAAAAFYVVLSYLAAHLHTFFQ